MTDLADLQAQLAVVERKLAQNARQSDSVSGARLNPAAEIGGIRSRSTKRKRQIAAKRDRLAREYVALAKERDRLQGEIAAVKRRPVRQQAQAIIEQVLRDKLHTGDRVETQYGVVTVVRCNAKSVTIETDSGFRDRVAWNHIRPVEWERMYQEWKVEHE